jgi:hypothetical protein
LRTGFNHGGGSEVVPHVITERFSTSQYITRIVARSSAKIFGVILAGCALGIFDGLNVLYVHVGANGMSSVIAYQAGFMIASGVAAFICLSEAGWSKARKLSTIFVALFVATIADNISIDVQAGVPYLLWVPQEGWEWRNQEFGHTMLAPLAYLIDGRTFGILDGYLISIGALSAYLCLQYRWGRR